MTATLDDNHNFLIALNEMEPAPSISWLKTRLLSYTLHWRVPVYLDHDFIAAAVLRPVMVWILHLVVTFVEEKQSNTTEWKDLTAIFANHIYDQQDATTFDTT